MRGRIDMAKCLIAFTLGAATALGAVPAVAKTNVCPGPSTLPGNDVSYWQGTIDWAKVKAAGRKFVIMRISHGLAVDTKFDFNWAECHKQGLHCGAYNYFEPNIDAIQQADTFLKKLGQLKAGDISPVIDVESTGGGMAPAAVAAAAGKWIAHVEKATGRKPIIYSGGYFWEDNVKSTAFVDYPLWHPQYCSNCCPNIANPWKKWYFWQYSSTGSVPGISGNVDMDTWNGTAADLSAFTGTAAPPTCTPACSGTVMTKADCSKSDCAPGEGTCVHDSLGLRCISKYCPAKGAAAVCLPSAQNALLGTCKDGKLTKGDCSAYGAFCSTVAAAEPKCVSAFCAKDAATKPKVGDVCLPDGVRYSCAANGDITKNPCPPDSTCQMQGQTPSDAAICKSKTCKPTCDGSKMVAADCGTIDCAAKVGGGMCVLGTDGPHCVDVVCPSTGSATVCLAQSGGMAIGICLEGVLTKATCKKGEEVCVEVGAGTSGAPQSSGALCAAAVCATNPPNLSPAHDVCGEDGNIVHCDAMGKASIQTCPAGLACVPGQIPPACQLDTGTEDAGGADAGSADAGASGEDLATVDGAGADDSGAAGADDSAGGVGDGTLSGTDGGAATVPGGFNSSAPASGCGAGGQPAVGAAWGLVFLLAGTMLRRRRAG